jgi:hypothetical protein
MTDDDPPPHVDRTRQDDVDPAVRDFLDAMKATATGPSQIDPAVRKLYSSKVSLYLSIADPNVPDAVRNAFAKFLNELSKLSSLPGQTIQVTNCNDEFLLVPGLLNDAAFKKLTRWERAKSGRIKNVYICFKMKSSVPFSRLKQRMKPFLFELNLYMYRNHSLGDSSEEMATIGYLSPIDPDLLLDHIQSELNTEIQCINAQKDDDYLVENGLRRGVIGELVIKHGAVRGSSKQHGDIVNSRAVVVECPKSKMGYYLQTVQEAFRTFQWSPDMRKVKFVPFALKTDPKNNDIFTNMIVHNSLENANKAYAQVLGISRADMLELRDLLIQEGPNITNIAPTKVTDKQGRWRIYTSKDTLGALEIWLTENLATRISSLNMRIPVPGFETPHLATGSTRISSQHVQAIAAVATTVPHLADDASFPNLVVTRGRKVNRSGAWSSSPLAPPASGSPADPVIPHTGVPFQPQPTAPSHKVLSGLARQLEENKKWRLSLESSRQVEKVQQQAVRDTLTSLRTTIEEEKVEFQKQMANTAEVLAQLTDGQTGIQLAMSRRDAQHVTEVASMREEIANLTASVRELLQIGTSGSFSTPPRVHRTDTPPDSASAIPLSDSTNLLELDHKRSPDRSPSQQNPGGSKLSRITESMDTDVDQIARHHP